MLSSESVSYLNTDKLEVDSLLGHFVNRLKIFRNNKMVLTNIREADLEFFKGGY